VVDLNAVVRAMSLPDVGVQFAPSDQASFVAMPEAQIRQVINNLVVNARAHGQDPIAVSISNVADAAVLTVRDAGPGMHPEFVPLAAERFTRGDDARGRPGTGLGLALVAGIVERHRGQIRICSNDQHHRQGADINLECRHPLLGTTVTVAIPMIAKAPKANDSQSLA
jgi:two-component system OmpR family sensor kinase